MNKFEFGKPLVISNTEPSTLYPVLWVKLNNNGRISFIKEFNKLTGAWEESTDIQLGIQPIEFEVDTTNDNLPAEGNDALDALVTDGVHCIYYTDATDEPVYGTIKVVDEENMVTQDVTYVYSDAVVHGTRDLVDGEWSAWSEEE